MCNIICSNNTFILFANMYAYRSTELVATSRRSRRLTLPTTLTLTYSTRASPWISS